MKEHFSLDYTNSRKEAPIDGIKDFCERFKDQDLTYIGSFAQKSDGILIGDVVQIEGCYYKACISCGCLIGANRITTADFRLYQSYSPDKLLHEEECPIRVNVWNMEIDDEGPLVMYAFNYARRADRIVINHRDVDIEVNGKPVSREDFLNRRF